MYDLDAIEAINIEQLVTPLDRLLLRHGAVRRTRRSFDLAREAELRRRCVDQAKDGRCCREDDVHARATRRQ